MLSEKITILFDTADLNSSVVAKAAGCAPSTINRLKSGARTPKMTSPTVAKLVTGIHRITYEDEPRKTAICRLCGLPSDCTAEVYSENLLRWLCEDEVIAVKTQAQPEHTKRAPRAFGRRLTAVLKLAEMSNSDLSRQTGLNPSYLSRLRHGERTPRYDSPYIDNLCLALFHEIEQQKKLPALARLTKRPLELLSDKEGPSLLREWFFSHDPEASVLAIDRLLTMLKNPSEKVSFSAGELPTVEEIRAMMEKNGDWSGCNDYYGTEGIRKAVVRFLLNLLDSGEKEMLLYSDQDMSWMLGGFRAVLTSLMSACIRTGVRITIIHNIGRSQTEMLRAIEWWLPLYMTEQIESYYSCKVAGDRFSHTMFICPGQSCVAGSCVQGLETRCLYHYYDSAEPLAFYEASFQELLSNARRLIEVRPGAEPHPGDIHAGDDLLVQVTAKKVTVRYLTEPAATFVFTHPLMCQAFVVYFLDEGKRYTL